MPHSQEIANNDGERSAASKLQTRHSTPTSLGGRDFHPNASLVLVGIRGVGKRTLGFIAATALGRRFVTEDHFFQSVTGMSRQEYLRTHGSEEFHRHDVIISQRMLEENRSGCVIDCGLGSLTSSLQEYLRTYSTTNPVVHLLRDMQCVRSILSLNDRSAKLLESGDLTHRRCSNYEYFNLEEDLSESDKGHGAGEHMISAHSFRLRNAQADFSNFVKFITRVRTQGADLTSPFSLRVPIESQTFTHNLEIPFSLYDDAKISIPTFQSAGDVVEVIVDRWHTSSTKSLSALVADIRRHLKVPLIVSVARKQLDLSPQSYIHVLQSILRLGIEFLSVDTHLEAATVGELKLQAGPTKFIGTSLFSSRTSSSSAWRDGTAMTHLRSAWSSKFDIIRLMHQASTRTDNEDVAIFLDSVKGFQPAQQVPVVAFNVGHLGRTSQIFNSVLTSVTHQDILLSHNGAASVNHGQLTSRQITQALFSTFVLDPLKFFIIGGNVTQSLSPAMHQAAYRFHGLNHSYSTKNIKSWEDVESLARDLSFGGASIVQPWKVRLADQVEYLSEHAKIIGAINTLMPLRKLNDGATGTLRAQAQLRNRSGPVGAWYGENTDWIAMAECIARSLSPRNVVQPKSTALVVGAGGMARAAVYALVKLGFRNLFIYNRTPENAESLVAHYDGWLSTEVHADEPYFTKFRILEKTTDEWPSEYVPPTVVISCVTHEHLEGRPDSDFTMPAAWLASESGGVVLELAYMTHETPLVSQLKEYRQTSGKPWIVIDGIVTLFEQALAQFEVMTGKLAPKLCMQGALDEEIRHRRTFAADGAEFEVSR